MLANNCSSNSSLLDQYLWIVNELYTKGSRQNPISMIKHMLNMLANGRKMKQKQIIIEILKSLEKGK